MVNILNECFNAFANFALSNFFAFLLSTHNLVAGECFTKHGDKRTVAGEEHGMCRLVAFSTASGDI